MTATDDKILEQKKQSFQILICSDGSIPILDSPLTLGKRIGIKNQSMNVNSLIPIPLQEMTIASTAVIAIYFMHVTGDSGDFAIYFPPKGFYSFVKHMYDTNLLKLWMYVIKGMINEFIPLHTVILFGLKTSHNNNYPRQIY